MEKLQEILTILVEECAEVTQLACKIQRFGLNSSHPSDPTTNKQLLTSELGDLLAMINLLIEASEIDPIAVESAKAAKILRLHTWSKIFN